MKDYVAYVERNPRDPHSMFHEYVLNRYKEAHESNGFTLEAANRVLRSVQDELNQRKARSAGE
jgi:hypothetical protein